MDIFLLCIREKNHLEDGTVKSSLSNIHQDFFFIIEMTQKAEGSAREGMCTAVFMLTF